MPYTSMAKTTVKPLKKVTVHIPEDLLKAAQEQTKESITQTINQGLKKITASAAYKELGLLEGTCKLQLDLDALREDRDA